jgi:2-amino-4-hydroxy-6-hydroxymethyldihydropteridine diphosphokinase
VKVGVALGSNSGDRRQNIDLGFTHLEKRAVGRQIKRSSIIETDPIECPPDSPGFLNAVAEIEYRATPQSLLQKLKQIETRLGREKNGLRNAPRPLDLDILYFGDLRISEPNLIIPHIRMMERRFVLQPLAEIRPDLVLPGQVSNVQQLLQQLINGR